MFFVPSWLPVGAAGHVSKFGPNCVYCTPQQSSTRLSDFSQNSCFCAQGMPDVEGLRDEFGHLLFPERERLSIEGDVALAAQSWEQIIILLLITNLASLNLALAHLRELQSDCSVDLTDSFPCEALHL